MWTRLKRSNERQSSKREREGERVRGKDDGLGVAKGGGVGNSLIFHTNNLQVTKEVGEKAFSCFLMF